MQQQGGFLDQGNKSPTSLMLVAGMHVAAIGALILFPPTFVRTFSDPIILQDYREDKPPPPIPDTPPPPEKTADDTVTRPPGAGPATTREDPVDLSFNDDIVRPPLPPGPKVDPIPEPTRPDPILTDPIIDSRAPFQPSYPPRLARQDVEGSVVVRVLIGSDGRVKAVEQVSATESEFFEATKKQALRFWRFKPATRDGVAVESWRTMTVRFEMKA